MSRKILPILLSFVILNFLTSCARDLGGATYTSDSTLNIILKGKVVAKRFVTVKNHDKLMDNRVGYAAGMGLGAALGSRTKNAFLTAGGGILGSLAGAFVESKMGTSTGVEYIVQVDRNQINDGYYQGGGGMRNAIAAIKATGNITVVQSGEDEKNSPVNIYSDVHVIISDNRTRIVPMY